MKTIVLAEDHAIIRDGLKLLIATRPAWKVVGETGDGLTVEQTVRETHADLLLLDLDLPGVHGIELTRRLKAEFAQMKILILTGNPHPATVNAAFAAGADGYMLKHEDAGELLTAISLVLSGIAYLSVSLKDMADTSDKNTAVPITDREKEILSLIAAGNSSQEIAGQLSLSVLTVRKHRQNLMSKLSLHNTAEVTAYAMRDGLLNR
jgi:DNA-binding NarL/FixJ family response regulator